MNKTTYKLFFLFVLLCTALSTFAAPEAEYKKITKTYQLNADGSQEFRCATELTLYTHTAMNGTYGESFIVYNPHYQELQIHASYTVQKDGNVVKAPENAFVEVLPRFATDAPYFNNLKEMVVVHTGLELGATIFLDYSVITKPGFYPAFDLFEPLLQTSPVKECNMTITVPESTPLSYHLYNANAKAVESTGSQGKTVSWKLQNLPASSRESFQPENLDNVPLLVANTFGSQSATLGRLKQCFDESNDYESQAFAQYITEKAANEKEKIDIIHRHVANNISLSPVPMRFTGFTIRDADEVLRSAYGTATEKTKLLCSMLNAAGVKSEIVAIYPGTVDPSTGGIHASKGLAVKTTEGGKELYLSALSAAPATVTARGTLDRLFTLDGKELSVNAQPLVVKQTREETAGSKAEGNVVVSVLTAPSEGIDTWQISSLPTRRDSKFEIPSLLQEEITYKVKPAEGLSLKTAARNTVISQPGGKVAIRITPQADGTVEVVRSIELNQLQFTPAEYAGLRTLLNEWADPNNSLLIWQAQ